MKNSMELAAFAFDSTCTFKFEHCLFKFQDREFILFAGNEEYCEVIQTIVDNQKERDEVFQIVNKFLFCYGWSNNCSFHFVGSGGRGLAHRVDLLQTKQMIFYKRNYRNIIVNFDTITITKNNELEIALSLCNDAKYTNDNFYRFLCYWKILDINCPRKSRNPSEWINYLIENKHNIHITDYVKDLLARKINVGDYFYNKCRNAIAHVTRKPSVFSFNVDDYRQISGACLAIEPFVNYFITKEIGIPKYNEKIEIIKKINKPNEP